MKTRYLFPHACKPYAWAGLIVSTLLLLVVYPLSGYPEYPFLNATVFALADGTFGTTYFCLVKNNLTNEILMTLAIVSGILVGFSKEKTEDEFIAKIRLESLFWATYINYGFLLLSIWLVYGLPFLTVLSLNMCTFLWVFIIRFHFIMYRSKKEKAV